MGLYTYFSKKMIEYHTIFPDVLSVLHHILNVNGNGFEYDPKRGFISYEGEYISETPDFDPRGLDIYHYEIEQKKIQIAQVVNSINDMKDKEYAHSTLPRYGEELAKIGKLAWVDLTDEDFTVKKLYSLLLSRRKMYRPYPWCEYARILKVKKGDNAQLEMICVNYCKAWIKYLKRELRTGSYLKDKGNPDFHRRSKNRTKEDLKMFKKVLANLT